MTPTSKLLRWGVKVHLVVIVSVLLIVLAARKRGEMREQWEKEWRSRPYHEQTEPTWFERLWYGVE